MFAPFSQGENEKASKFIFPLLTEGFCLDWCDYFAGGIPVPVFTLAGPDMPARFCYWKMY